MHWTSPYRKPPAIWPWPCLDVGPHCTGTPNTDIWWPRLETCSNLFTWRPTPPQGALVSVGYWSTYGWQVDGTRPAGILSCCLKGWTQHFSKQWQVQDFPDSGRQPKGGANLLFGQFFPENCMKIKEIGPRGEARSSPPDPPMPIFNFFPKSCHSLNDSHLKPRQEPSCGLCKLESGIKTSKIPKCPHQLYVLVCDNSARSI